MKVAVKVNSEVELLAVQNEADKNNLVNYLVRDSDKSKRNGLVLAIGPDSIEDINVVTGHLKLL
jgi:peptidyl-tRNA hydrolase